jgi:SAM-dependent methyltransferase
LLLFFKKEALPSASFDCLSMTQLPGLPARAFDKADSSPDRLFYQQPRFVTHIDDGAITAVTQLYRETLPLDSDLFDVMSSWVSHYPSELVAKTVTGHGLNAEELGANPIFTDWFVQDLNETPMLPLEAGSRDAATICVSVQYLQRPVDVFRDLVRVLRPGSPLIITFSNRCFPTKAVHIWQSLEGPDQQRLVAAYLDAAGFADVRAAEHTPPGSDPIWAVIGRTVT